MRARFAALGLFSILAASSLAAEPAPANGEAKLQAMLQGYAAGPPQRCLQTSRIRGFKVVDGTAIVATMGGTLYVNRPINASALREDLIPFFDNDAGLVCDGASVSLNSSHDLFSMGAVRLKEWVPYRRIDKK